MSAKSEKRPRRRTPSVRVSLDIPMPMRQVIRNRERMSGSSCADVIRLTLLNTFRLEIEAMERGAVSVDGGKLKALA